jgi:ABC-type uncharacterized transport system permease subunit
VNDRVFLWLAQVFYLASVLLTVYRLRQGGVSERAARANFAVMVGGFALHTAFLYLRGQNVGRCPLTNLFEAQAFIAWAAVLFFLVIGTAYRVSFLGAFTAPLALAICVSALVAPVDVPRAAWSPQSPWVEFHAAIAILAYGAFGLACVASAMYLLQERQLKSRRLSPAFLQLPSIEQLNQITFRLVVLGFALLTAGMIGGFVSYQILGHWTTPKIVWAVLVWLLYGGVLLAHRTAAWRGRKVALATVSSFALALVSYWGVSLVPNILHRAP